ncbi:hypothetical protein GCM10010329_06260 [Streptomyces spiroverticillatus]|uniref:Uncharacterized protein n=1 Tax=Streptomyces finlayi TaxID=67296 RepID=A0A918WT73_9ACTN|nr:hypothetical protein [Streptomyces finlayi]GGZ88796.1 hypothetical protein GCM10010329_06260 [Streptomyces spiroverticillatus]GHC79749.1 hypothetical protein GCM10010334_06240 [Streptomyces finlayi]
MSIGHGGPSDAPGANPPHGTPQPPTPQGHFGPPPTPTPPPAAAPAPAGPPSAGLPAASPPWAAGPTPPGAPAGPPSASPPAAPAFASPPWAAGPPPGGGTGGQGGRPLPLPAQPGTPRPTPDTAAPFSAPHTPTPHNPYAAPHAPHAPQGPTAQVTPTTPTPDWSALADAATTRTRRKRLLYIGGALLATLTVAALVTTAIVSSGTSPSDGKNTSLPSPESLPTDPGAPTPSFSPVAPPPPPDPKEFISSAEKDKAPLSADTLFPGNSLTLEGRTYPKGATNRVTDCASGTQGNLGGILNANGCTQLIRATFTKDGAAVTVGVAVFPTEAQALKAKNQVKDGVASLPGSGVPTFCRNGTICRKTANSYGRYAYFTVSGFTDNKRNVTPKDKNVFALGDDAAKYTFLRIVERGRVQASAAATADTTASS